MAQITGECAVPLSAKIHDNTHAHGEHKTDSFSHLHFFMQGEPWSRNLGSKCTPCETKVSLPHLHPSCLTSLLVHLRCAELGLNHVSFFHGDCFNIDVESSMQYDRVYIGAGAETEAKFLFKLCKPGGIVCGPFQMDEGYQSLKKARRVGSKDFAVWDLLPVTFEPLRRGEGPAHTRRLVMRATRWTPHVHDAFPVPFKHGINTILHACKGDSIVSCLPKELWFRIFSFLDREWLSRPHPGQLCGSCMTSSTSAHCGRCKVVRYCSKECQRKHWKVPQQPMISQPRTCLTEASLMLDPFVGT